MSNTTPEPSLAIGTAPNRTLSNAVWNTVGSFSGIVISFVSAPLLITSLGVSQYGTLLLIGSITGILGVMNFGLGEATLRYVAHHLSENDLRGVNRVFGSTLTFYSGISATTTAIFLLMAPAIASWLSIAPGKEAEVSWLLRVSAVSFSAGMITSAFAVIPFAAQRYDIGTRVAVCVNLARSGGYVALAVSGFGLIPIIVWDLVVNIAVMGLFSLVVRRLIPGIRLSPSMSLRGLREILGYSIFSFLTWAFHTLHRESGKLLLGRFLGTAPVAYLGTPDNIAQRLHMVVASGSEALLPRFSTDRDTRETETLYWKSLWLAMTLSLVLLVPFIVLVPEFLRIWISEDFSRHSGVIGQIVGLYLISQGAFAPVAAYFRGTGKPWLVTAVILAALLTTLVVCSWLIPTYGVKGAAYAYLLGSSAPFLGVFAGSVYAWGSRSLRRLARTFLLPAVAGAVASLICVVVREAQGRLTWAEFFMDGVMFVLVTGLLVIGSDLVIGSSFSPSRDLLNRVVRSRRFSALTRFLQLHQPAANS